MPKHIKRYHRKRLESIEQNGFSTPVVYDEDIDLYENLEINKVEQSCSHAYYLHIQSDIAFLEYSIHVSWIFIETLMCSRRKITSENIEQIKQEMRKALKYFEDWYHHAFSTMKGPSDKTWEKRFISQITYNNLRIGVCGFLKYYAELVLNLDGITFVTMLSSSTSSIEATFSQVRAHGGDVASSFARTIASIDGRKSMAALGTSNKMYESHSEIGKSIK